MFSGFSKNFKPSDTHTTRPFSGPDNFQPGKRSLLGNLEVGGSIPPLGTLFSEGSNKDAFGLFYKFGRRVLFFVKIDWPKLLACLALTAGAAILGSLVTIPAISGWYSSLSKPAFTPPSWIFGPVWTVLYFLMALSLYQIWIREKDKKLGKKVSESLHYYWLQLVLNVLWSYLFFGLRNPLFALFEILFLWGSVFMTFKAFSRIDKIAGWLLVPYLAWISFAVLLNASIWLANP